MINVINSFGSITGSSNLIYSILNIIKPKNYRFAAFQSNWELIVLIHFFLDYQL